MKRPSPEDLAQLDYIDRRLVQVDADPRDLAILSSRRKDILRHYPGVDRPVPKPPARHVPPPVGAFDPFVTQFRG